MPAFATIVSTAGSGTLPVSRFVNAASTCSAWGFGQNILLPWALRISTEDTPNTDAKREGWFRHGGATLSLWLNVPKDPCSVEILKFVPKSITLQHSWLHDDGAVIRDVLSWLKHQLLICSPTAD